MDHHGDDDDHRRMSNHAELTWDDTDIEGMMKGLVNQKRLQGAWGKLGKRLRHAEAIVEEMTARTNQLREEFLPKDEYKNLVVAKHVPLLASHSEILEQLEEITKRHSRMTSEQSVFIQDCLEKQYSQDATLLKVQSDNSRIWIDVKDFRETIEGRLQELSDRLNEQKQEQTTATLSLSEEHKESKEAIWKEMKTSDARMEVYTTNKVSGAVKAALTFDATDGEGPGPDHSHLLDMVDRELVGDVREALARNAEELAKLSSHVSHEHTEVARMLRAVEAKTSGTHRELDDHKKEIKADLAMRPDNAAMREVEQLIRKDLSSVGSLCDSVQTRTIQKMNEFVDHVKKMHATIFDHEHCLRHHAEEIENRSTKYDMLLCQTQIEKCASQDETIVEMKQVVEWQTSKIEAFGLGQMLSSPKKFNDKGFGKAKTETPRRAAGMTLEQASVKRELRPASPEVYGVGDSILGEEFKKSPEVYGVGDSVPGEVMLSEKISRSEGTTRGISKEASPDQSRPESAVSVSTSSMLTQQLEALAMALVGLASILLAPPQLGSSAQTKNEQKQEILGELSSLRHWVTHKNMPPGWDPSKLTSIALRSAAHQGAVHTAHVKPPHHSRSPERHAKDKKPTIAEPPKQFVDMMMRASPTQAVAKGEHKMAASSDEEAPGKVARFAHGYSDEEAPGKISQALTRRMTRQLQGDPLAAQKQYVEIDAAPPVPPAPLSLDLRRANGSASPEEPAQNTAERGRSGKLGIAEQRPTMKGGTQFRNVQQHSARADRTLSHGGAEHALPPLSATVSGQPVVGKVQSAR